MGNLPVSGTKAGSVDKIKPMASLYKRDMKTVFRGQSVLMMMSIPFIIHLLVFYYGPLFGWLMAFHEYRPRDPLIRINKETWVGLQQFRYLFSEPYFWQVLRNTLGMAIISLTMGTFFAVFVAVMINETKNRLFKRSVQTISYLPHFISWVVAANLVREALMPDGVINNIITMLPWINKPVFFLGKPQYFWWVIGWSHVWKTAGFGAIIYLAAMTSIDPQLYEAADIDGASRIQRILHITLPGIRATFVILLIMNIGHLLGASFEQQYLLMNPLVQDVAEVFEIYVLRYGLRVGRYSYGAAAGIFKSVVSIILIIIANSIAKKLGEETLL